MIKPPSNLIFVRVHFVPNPRLAIDRCVAQRAHAASHDFEIASHRKRCSFSTLGTEGNARNASGCRVSN